MYLLPFFWQVIRQSIIFLHGAIVRNPFGSFWWLNLFVMKINKRLPNLFTSKNANVLNKTSLSITVGIVDFFFFQRITLFLFVLLWKIIKYIFTCNRKKQVYNMYVNFVMKKGNGKFATFIVRLYYRITMNKWLSKFHLELLVNEVSIREFVYYMQTISMTS